MVLRIKRCHLVAIGLLFIGAALSAQDLEVSIRLYDEHVYFPDSSVQILITLSNQSPENVTFRLADDRRFNNEFDVRNQTNQRAERTREFTIAQQANQQIYYRTVLLRPGEQLSFVERLDEYVDIQDAGMYTVQAQFYPQLRSLDPQTVLFSNPVTLSVRPGSTPEIQRETEIRSVVEQQLRRENISPDQVVAFMLDSLQQNNWERFFLYLNLEKIYRQSPPREERYIRLGEEAQIEELLEFRDQLSGRADATDAGLVAVPSGYEIIETRYTPTDGQVTARLHFDRDGFRERRQYTYELERRNGFWEIIGYFIANLPNEALPR
jgi:hypothetical protein